MSEAARDAEAGAAPAVRAALGWRARDVERASTAPVRFRDRDRSTVVVEGTPSVLAYADPAHGFVLPAGRFVRVDQAAGRVYRASATPHLDALTAGAAHALADSVGALLVRAGWAPVPGAGPGAAVALRAAARAAVDPHGGMGVADVGVWHLPRPVAPWAALPVGAGPAPREWDGPEATVDVQPVRPADPAGNAGGVRFVLQVQLQDDPLQRALFDQVDVRRARLGGAAQTLTSWERDPVEDADRAAGHRGRARVRTDGVPPP